MKLLHLTYDYPDIINPNKTEAIKNIINISNEVENTYCISLNRTVKYKNLKIYRGNHITALDTFGLPRGIFFSYTLRNSIRRVLSAGVDIESFDRLHAHKLTFEGPIAHYIKKKYGIPYIISIQQTDFKVLRHKPLMVAYYYDILLDAEKIIMISPWMEDELKEVFGSKRISKIKYKISSIPLIVDRKKIFRNADNGRFLCVFHMRSDYIKIKNIYRVLKAISLLKNTGVIIKLDIAGDGAARDVVEEMVRKLGIDSQVSLIGKVGNSDIVELMSYYKAFVLCSYPETFGMVYIEALCAGIPVIYSKNAGIDGFFDDKGIGISVKHNNIDEICSALREMDSSTAVFKDNVRKLQENGYLEMFSMESVKQKYKLLQGKEV